MSNKNKKELDNILIDIVKSLKDDYFNSNTPLAKDEYLNNIISISKIIKGKNNDKI